MPHRSITPLRQRGVVLFSVLIVSIAVATLLGAVFWAVQSNATAAAFSLDRARCDFLAEGALHRALWEITAQDDSSGEGLGAMGVAVPVPFNASDGTPLGEYRSTVDQVGNRVVVLAVAAIPSFADPDILRSVEGLLTIDSQLLFAPEPGAIYIAGPVTDPVFSSMGTGTVSIDGGVFPAIATSSSVTYDSLMDAFGDLIFSGDITGAELAGGLDSDYSHVDAGTITLPVVDQDMGFLTTTEMNDYRTQLRTSVLSMAATPDRTITAQVTGDQTWGTAGTPEVTVIESATIGMNDVFGTDGQTITGHGTLIIKDTLRPGGNGTNLNINWTGDVYVVGDAANESGDMLYLSGTQGSINGNLILLSSDDTEASLELDDSSTRPSDLTVNGAVLALAEANSNEAEVEVEASSRLTVNGWLGLYGSRIELEASSSSGELNINGTLGIGMAQDLDEGAVRPDDFAFDMTGTVNITYDKDLVHNAIDGLTELQTNLSLAPSTDLDSYKFSLSGMGSTKSGAAAVDEIDLLLQTHGAGYDYGIDPMQLGGTP